MRQRRRQGDDTPLSAQTVADGVLMTYEGPQEGGVMITARDPVDGERMRDYGGSLEQETQVREPP